MSQSAVETVEKKEVKFPEDEEDIKFEQQIVDAIKKLPLEQRLQVVALNHYLLTKKTSDFKLGNQMEEIGSKYQKVQEPLMEKVNQIISGERGPTEAEVEEAKTHLAPEEVEKIKDNLTADAIPDYWYNVLKKCVRLEKDIFEVDHPLLKKITKIENVPEGEDLDFVVKFHFAENEYFENPVLTAKFIMADDEMPEKVEGTDIKWKEGKDITVKSITKKKKNKKTGKKVNVTKIVESDSFFNFFKTLEGAPEEEEDDEEEGGNEALDKLQDRYDIAATIQEEILLYHLEYYLGLRKGDEDNEYLPNYGQEAEEEVQDMGEKIAKLMAAKKKAMKK